MIAEVMEWLEAHVLIDEASDRQLARIQVSIRSILFVGSKSPSHLSTTLDRYSALLNDLISPGPGGPKGLEEELVVQASRVYAVQPQRVLMVVDRLLGLGIIKPYNVSTSSSSAARVAFVALRIVIMSYRLLASRFVMSLHVHNLSLRCPVLMTKEKKPDLRCCLFSLTGGQVGLVPWGPLVRVWARPRPLPFGV